MILFIEIKISKLINYSTNMCGTCQGSTIHSKDYRGTGVGEGGLQVINSKVQTKPITLVLEPLIAHSRCFSTIGNLAGMIQHSPTHHPYFPLLRPPSWMNPNLQTGHTFATLSYGEVSWGTNKQTNTQ
jgi:hypothetical protein